MSDDTPMPTYRLALTMLVDAQRVDPSHAFTRARIALRVPAGPARGIVDHVVGEELGQEIHAKVYSAEMLSWRQLEDDR